MSQYLGEFMKRKITFITALLLVFSIAIVPIMVSGGTVSASELLFEQQVADFPVSYQAALTNLYNLHPNWIFKPVYIDDSWSTVISKETSPDSISLISKSSDKAWIKNYTVYDGSSWVPASSNIVAYYMDPRNFLTEQAIFQFEKLSYDPATQTTDGVNAIMGTNQSLRGLTSLVMEAAQSANVSAYLLASRIRQEVSEGANSITNSARGDIDINYPPLTAGGISPSFMSPVDQLNNLLLLVNPTAQQQTWIAGLQATPQVPLPMPSVRYYNLYNIGATPNVSVIDGARINAITYAMGSNSAYNLPWDSQQKAAVGGARYIAANYIAQGQDTMYFQKFAVSGTLSNRYWHQYMQNIQAAYSEGLRYYNGYSQVGALNNAYTFRIPVYTGMPDSAVMLPTVTNSTTQANALPGNVGRTVQITGGGIYNLRSQPSSSSTITGQVTAGSLFVIQGVVTGGSTSYGNQWYAVTYNGQTAYLVVDLSGEIVLAQVAYNSQGGSSVSSLITGYYSKISAPAAPTRPGYIFAGWYKDAACTSAWNFGTDVVPGNITLYAGWTKIDISPFVDRFYLKCFNRPADGGGLSYWVPQLEAGLLSGGDLAKQLIFSTEFLNRNLTNDEYITIMYQAFFNRDPDAAGKAYWMSQFDSGLSRYYVLAGFINSQEFRKLCTAYGINPGSLALLTPVDRYPQITSFVTRFYTICLGRMPDPVGLDHWVVQLQTKNLAGANVAKDIITSTEFVNRGTSSADYLEILYQAFFGRASDASGKDYWVKRLNAGTSRYTVLVGFVNSQEFTNICSAYGINRGSLK